MAGGPRQVHPRLRGGAGHCVTSSHRTPRWDKVALKAAASPYGTPGFRSMPHFLHQAAAGCRRGRRVNPQAFRALEVHRSGQPQQSGRLTNFRTPPYRSPTHSPSPSKSVVPIRTSVAPSSTATSKSPLMPIDRSGNFQPVCARRLSRRRRSSAKAGRASSGLSEYAAIVISPRTTTPSIDASLSPSVVTTSDEKPPFAASRLQFTSNSIGRPARIRPNRESIEQSIEPTE